MVKFKNIVKHFKLVCKHKYYVYKYCAKAGMRWRGLKHDMSKFSPIEFFESVKYFDGSKSPIDVCKEKNGYSKAWLHHKGRNSHHYEYWVDNFDKGGQPLIMPYKDALELVCDYLGAGKAYMKENFSYGAEFKWWRDKIKNPIAMHPSIISFVDALLLVMKEENNNDVLKFSRSYLYYKERVINKKEGFYDNLCRWRV